ncbi:MAG: DUF6651 domain-containing protein, partial [Casimicrobium sp.]
KEIAFDAPSTVATISRLNAEAKGHREAKEAAETKLKSFDGIDDPVAAKKAMEITRNLDAKKLVDAGEVQKVREESIKAIEEKYAPTLKEVEALRGQLYAEKIGGSFARSKLIADKFAIPADLVQAKFGQSFSLEDGKIVAKDSNGNKIYSRARPGEIADFDEAIELLVDQYPHKDSILKGSGASGSGASQSGAQGAGGKRTVKRVDFFAMPADKQAAITKDSSIVIVD